jgi:hypothetical protein
VHGHHGRPCTRRKKREGKREGGVPPRVGKKEDKGERVPCRGVHDQVTCFRKKSQSKRIGERRKMRGGVMVMMSTWYLKQKGREKRECMVVFEQVMKRFTQDCHIMWVGMVVIMVVPKLNFEERSKE